MSAFPINLGGGALIDLGELWGGLGSNGAGWTLVAVLLINLGGAAALALVARGVDGVWGARWPAVAHALWLLVLVELVVPPVLGVAILPPAEEAVVSAALPAGAHGSLARDALPSVVPAGSGWPGVFAGGCLLCACWIAGVGLLAVLSGARARRFRLRTSRGVAADADLTGRVETLARRLGIGAVPGALVVPARVPPLLRRTGRRYELVIPAELVKRLESAELDAVIAHELAHAARRDPWIRWLELLVTTVFWWYPVAWWARRRLRRAEERCCDAIVVGLLPGARRSYATALVKTMEFLAGHVSPLPDTASGASVTHDLHERLTMILKHRPRPRLSSLQKILMGVAALVLLLVFPTRAQRPDEPADNQPAAPAVHDEQARAEDELHDALARLEWKTLELERAQQELQRAQQELELQRIELQESRQLLLEESRHEVMTARAEELDAAVRAEDAERARREMDMVRQRVDRERARMELERQRMLTRDDIDGPLHEIRVEIERLHRLGRETEAAALEEHLAAVRTDLEHAHGESHRREGEHTRQAIEAEMDRLREKLDELRREAESRDRLR